jgi:cell division protein FtsZ
MFEVREVMDFVSSATATSSHVFYGQVFDESLEDKLKVTVIATGFPARSVAKERRVVQRRDPTQQQLAPASGPAAMPPRVNSPSEDELRRPAYLRIRNRKLK